MRLDSLYLRNFRCFKELKIEFDPKMTVIVAENGAGKTAILDAIAIGFGRYLTKLPGVAGRSIKDTDLRIDSEERAAPFTMMSWSAHTRDGAPITWSGGRKRDGSVTAASIRNSLSEPTEQLLRLGFKQLDEFALECVRSENEGGAYFLPVIAYYGTNRAIRDEVQRRRGFRKQFSRFEALSGALDPDSRFRAAFEWFNAMEDQERRGKEARRDFDYRQPELQLVREAIVRVLPVGFSNPRTEIRPLRFVIDRLQPTGERQTLRISQLSDGYRVVLGLAMDLARRMAQANSRLTEGGHLIANPLDLPAIALIDEVDLHLHPSWQQRVLIDLTRTFRGTQFIVTTHSPQVLTSVDASCIRLLHEVLTPEMEETISVVETVPTQTRGVSSADLLARIMGVNPVPAVPEANMVSDYHALIQQNRHETDEGLRLRTQLEEHFGANHPVLRECDRLVRLQAFKERLPKNPGRGEA